MSSASALRITLQRYNTTDYGHDVRQIRNRGNLIQFPPEMTLVKSSRIFNYNILDIIIL